MTKFTRLSIQNWRQFDNIDIEFHPRLTILTGANGAGKTTLLHLLNRHWGWNIPYVSTPRFDRKGVRKYWAGFWSTPSDGIESLRQAPHHEIGAIEYSDAQRAQLVVPADVQETFAVNIQPQPTLSGVYVPSHRPLYVHQKVESIPTDVDAREQLFNVYMGELRKRWSVNQRVRSPNHMLKESLISLATFGHGNEAVIANTAARRTFEGFEDVLRKVLPPSFGFRKLQIRTPDVLLETDTEPVSIDAVSGGISALIDIAWQVHLYSTLAEEFIVAIDEPEAHLHPELQRTVLPSLLQAFPQAQFIVASHNPFVVGCSADSSVYVLAYHDRRVRSTRLDQVNKAGTANELLRDALGLESTSALWVEDLVSEVLRDFEGQDLSQEVLDSLRQRLQSVGMSRYLPRAIDHIREG